MRPTAIAVAVLALLLLATSAEACTARSQKAKRAFVHANACPATGLHRLPCNGYVIDHHVGLCVGGSDTPSNMRWVTIAAAKAKDKWECKPGWQERLRECEARGCGK